MSTTRPNIPNPMSIAKAEEPYIRAAMMLPERYLGTVMKLCMEKRGVNSNLNYTGPGRAELTYEMPLAEVIYDFYDRFKSVTQGYGSFDYDLIDYRESNLALLDILVNGEKVDALSQIVHRDRARARGAPGLRKAEGGDPPADVQDRHPGGHRRRNHLPHHDQSPSGRT